MLAASLFLGIGGTAPPGLGQGGLSDPTTLEEAYEKAFAYALEMPEDAAPVSVLRAWQRTFGIARMLEKARRQAAGGNRALADAEVLEERILQRWQRLRSEAGGPDLFRALRIRDAEDQRVAVIALVDRYPNDPLVVWKAIGELLLAGEIDRASEVAESFLSRLPDHPRAYHELAHTAEGDEPRLVEVLRRWAHAEPGDPALVSRWLDTRLSHEDPEATRLLLDDFFARQPTGEEGLDACLQVMRMGDPTLRKPTRDCLARIVADSEMSRRLSERATWGLAIMAADDGDWASLLGVSEVLERKSWVRALISAARHVEASEQCGAKIELLSLASEALEDDEDYRQAASVLRICSERSEARALFLALLRQAPASRVREVVHTWVDRVSEGGRVFFRSGLPEGVAGLLEQRLRAEPGAAELYAALDVVYEAMDSTSGRLDLLRRWYQRAPASFGGEQAAALAQDLVDRGQPAAAIELLERQLEKRFDPRLAEMLRELSGGGV